MKFEKVVLLLLVSFFVALPSFAAEIQIKGSDTIIRLTQRLAEVYSHKHPDVRISVSGGGTGNGIAAIINKNTDIADASREMQPAELAQAAKHHVNPSKVVIAVDAVAIIVNQDIPVRSLTIDQVGAIFRGDIKNWKELGGPARPITLYGRQSSSGTFGFLRSVALRADYSDKMAGLQGNAEIVEAVKSDRTGIGYVGVAFVRKAEGITVLSLALAEDQPFLSPLDREVVLSGAYPLTRPLIQYVDGVPRGELKGFLDFELSPEGQKIIEEEGFFPIPAVWHK